MESLQDALRLVVRMTRENQPARPARVLQSALKAAAAEAAALMRLGDRPSSVTVELVAGDYSWLERSHLRWLERLSTIALLRGKAVFTDVVGAGVDEPAPDGVHSAWFVPLPYGKHARLVLALLNPNDFNLAQILEIVEPLVAAPATATGETPRSAGAVPQKSILSSEQEAIRAKERKRLSYDLHDGPARRLVECLFRLDKCERGADLDKEALLGEIRATGDSLRRALEQMRSLVHRYRTISDEDNLQTGLLNIIEDFQNLSSASVTLEFPSEPLGLNAEQIEILHAVVDEALFNAWRHAAPTAVAVTVRRAHLHSEVVISDNGRGFDTSVLRTAGKSGTRVGLLGVRERIEDAGGHLRIRSEPGRGTLLIARFNVGDGAQMDQDQRIPAL